jgi:hypothetical protein
MRFQGFAIGMPAEARVKAGGAALDRLQFDPSGV